ncbi:hypothetical protein ACIRBY_05920 [Streptomyces sp. NPDC096136]|uniref:hypothetical protein n=1 Tax=Streptomyces sp. NPDC096136 TaxID=3366076 RepID=UPI0037F8C5AE
MPTCFTIGVTPAASLPSSGVAPDRAQRSTIFHEDVVRPTCERFGLTLLRADELMAAGLPTDQLVRLITEADVVIADLDRSAGALSFGLGMRHGLGRCTVHVAERPGSPFAAGGIPIVEMPSLRAGAQASRRQLGTVLTEVFPEVSQVSPQTEPAEQSRAAPREELDEDAPGLFDLVAEAEAQLEAITDDMDDVESALTDLGAMMELVAEDMVRVSQPGASMGTRLAVVKRLAKAIDGPADELEAAAERFAGRMQAAVIAFGAFLDWTGNTPRGEWPDGVIGLLDQVVGMSGDIKTAADGYQEVMAVMELFATSSRHLRRPVRRIGTSFQTLFRSVAVFESWRDLAEELRGS